MQANQDSWLADDGRPSPAITLAPDAVVRDLAPTRNEVMSLIHQYALARIVANASVPTKSQSESTSWHERDEQEVARLEAEIAAALIAAGLK